MNQTSGGVSSQQYTTTPCRAAPQQARYRLLALNQSHIETFSGVLVILPSYSHIRSLFNLFIYFVYFLFLAAASYACINNYVLYKKVVINFHKDPVMYFGIKKIDKSEVQTDKVSATLLRKT